MAYKDKARKTAYQNEFIKQSYDRINLTVPKGQKEKIQSVAAEQGESVNEYIKKAIAQRMERDTAGTDTAGGGYGISEGVQQGNSMKSVHLSSTDTSNTGQLDENKPFLPVPSWEDTMPELEEKLIALMQKRKVRLPTVKQYNALSPEQKKQVDAYLFKQREKAYEILVQMEVNNGKKMFF